MIDAKNYLKRLSFFKHRITETQREIEQRQTRIQRLRRYKDPVYDELAEILEPCVWMLQDFRRKYEQEYGKMLAMLDELPERSRKGMAFQRILLLKYVDDKPLGRIADELFFTVDTVFAYHGQAIEALSEILNRDPEDVEAPGSFSG